MNVKLLVPIMGMRPEVEGRWLAAAVHTPLKNLADLVLYDLLFLSNTGQADVSVNLTVQERGVEGYP